MGNKKNQPGIPLGHSNFICIVFRALVGVDRVCPVWWSPWLPEEEPWIEWYLLQRPGYQTQNQSDVTTADEICLANRWWNELLIFEKGESRFKRKWTSDVFLRKVFDNCRHLIKWKKPREKRQWKTFKPLTLITAPISLAVALSEMSTQWTESNCEEFHIFKVVYWLIV